MSDVVPVDVSVSSALDSVTVCPPVVNLQPCATASLEIIVHYADGVARDLSEQPDLVLTFAIGNAARSGVSEVVLDEPLDDTLIVSFDAILCTLRAALPGGDDRPKLDEFAMKKLQRALDVVREGALASKPNR